MRIRNFLLLAFLITALVPAAIFAVWSYQHGIKREFAEVNDRHLLLAHNLGTALDRYHTDLVGSIDSISSSLLVGSEPPNLESLMRSMNLICVFVTDETTGEILAEADVDPSKPERAVPARLIEVARSIALADRTVFSAVMANQKDKNVIVGAKRHAGKLAVAIISTDYFVELGKSISFGKKGHAAIVDRFGNVLFHPLPSWVKARKNIAKVSAVRRMMNGETGIEQFYSPALKGDMIAGLTSVKGPGWGVMIPQPIDELYAKVAENNRAIILAIAVGLLITVGFVLLFVNSLATPLEKFLLAMKQNARKKTISPTNVDTGLIPLREVRELNNNYNVMARRISNASAKVTELAFVDNVTGLPNRTRLQKLANEILHDYKSNKIGGALIFVDLDNFKQINDIYGHTIGDEYLKLCATRVKEVTEQMAKKVAGCIELPEQPLVARMGGDEFVIFFPGLTAEANIKRFMTSIRTTLNRPSGDLPYIANRGASLGCARYPADSSELPILLKLADIAMYHAKNSGKNQHQIYTAEIGTMTASELSVAVANAISHDEMVLEYQPKVCAKTLETKGVEALVRWDHPVNGRLVPTTWIPAIANTPVMRQLGEWVIIRAMEDQKAWAKLGLDVEVAVNVGAEHFADTRFPQWLIETSKANEFDPGMMEIEVTEDSLFVSGAGADDALRQVHAAGFKIAIDDFGTGYSNIARLSHLPVDTLKIDRSIVSEAHNNARVGSMMDCIILMAKKLGCKTVAEGIEHRDLVDYSAAHDIDLLQGFHFSKSLTASGFVEWFQIYELQRLGRETPKRKLRVA